MRERSREIIEILADVVRATGADCMIKCFDGKGYVEVKNPEITYLFGNAQYLKDCYDVQSKSYLGVNAKFPLIHLFCPVNEDRNATDCYSKAKVRVLIACSTIKEYSNAQRLAYSFINILRPVYRTFIEKLKEDGRLDFGYDDEVRHQYSENYSYGRYGAFTPTGEAVSEPIDAIVISNLELKVKPSNCN